MPVIKRRRLLNKLSGVNGYPVLLDAFDIKIRRGIRRVASGYSGIHLSNISSAYCFDIGCIGRRASIPVIHDDQQGNATVVIAALINAARFCHFDVHSAKVGVIGLA